MIITNCGIQDFTTEIIEPISEQIIRNIIKELSLTNFFKDNIYINSDYLTGSKTNDSELIPVLQKDRIDCDVTYIQDPNKNKWETSSIRHGIEYGIGLSDIQNLQVLFNDKNIKSTIYEHTSPCTISINCTISCLERSNASSIYTTLVNTLGGSEPTIPMNVFYNYLVPDPVMYLIGYFYLLSNIKNTVPFIDYIKIKSNNLINYEVNKNISKQKYGYIINKSEIELLVENTINDDKPQPVKNNKSTNHYTISFTLNAQFSKPNIIYMTYPIIINNQLVDSQFLPDNILERKDIYEHTSHPYIALKHGMEESKIIYNENIFRCPFYDNFKIPNTFLDMLGFVPFYMGATPIELQSNTTIDLSSNLGTTDYPIHIKQSVLDIINNKGISALDGSLPIVVTVYADDVMIEPTTLTFTGTTLTLTNKDISKIYRVIIYENLEITKNVQSLRVLKYILFTNNSNSI